jgi:hypothetical protein
VIQDSQKYTFSCVVVNPDHKDASYGDVYSLPHDPDSAMKKTNAVKKHRKADTQDEQEQARKKLPGLGSDWPDRMSAGKRTERNRSRIQ